LFDGEAQLESLKANAEVAATAAKAASDSATAVRAMADQLQRQLVAQKEAHEKKLARLEAQRVT
jgi:anti-sigma28 factor (negative regulator of flagellin synthesis)